MNELTLEQLIAKIDEDISANENAILTIQKGLANLKSANIELRTTKAWLQKQGNFVKRNIVNLNPQAAGPPRLIGKLLPYTSVGSMVYKINYVLDVVDKPLSLNGIADEIQKLEPDLERTKLISSLSANLSMKTKIGKDFKVVGTDENGNNLYGIIYWKDKELEDKIE